MQRSNQYPSDIIPDSQDELAILVRSAQVGDREAFNELFRRYQRVVQSVVYRRLGNDAETQEVCQDVFIQAMRKIDQLKNPVCFGGWIRSIASRMAINRAVRSRPVLPFEADQAAGRYEESETPLGSILARERRDQVHIGLGRLPDLDRSTLMAFYFDGQSIVEMSDQFNSPVGTIKRRLHVARKRLAKELETMATA